MSAQDRQIIFQSDSVKIGQFRASPGDGNFRCSGPPGSHLFVFPREGVWIEHEGRSPFVADANVVTFYNPEQEYYRSPVSRRGDCSDWFELPPEILETQFRRLGLAVDSNGDSIFPFTRGPSDPEDYLEQRRLVRRVRSGQAVDELEIEERVIALGERVIERAADRTCGRESDGASTRHRLLVEETRELLAERFRDRLTIAEIARELATSPFHLSRVFRSRTGLSLHQYRMRLRLAAGLLEISERPLTELALDLGFSSHSHFTSAFHQLFDAAPREIRASLDV